jgi:DNA helicase-2/ATP-dependent DNA helicase PcrA
VWRRAEREDAEAQQEVNFVASALRKCGFVEDFVWPRAGRDWLANLALADTFPDLHTTLAEFRGLVRRWQSATQLPIDQLLLTLAQDLFREPVDLALALRLAALLRRAKELHRDWQLPELTEELAVIARNERRFLGLGHDDSGFDPARYRGQVVLTTLHKAKGLEWDRVYLLSVNNYDFPSDLPHDSFIAEKWFVRDGLNLEAEALEQLDVLLDDEAVYLEGLATQAARAEYAGERLRLLYVGITRARRELHISWNTGRRGDLQPAVPLIALASYWERRRAVEGHSTAGRILEAQDASAETG